MTSPTIISLAILNVNWTRLNKDYLENFVPIVAECLRLSQHDVISLTDLQEQLVTQFGLRLPQNLIGVLLRRVKKRGYVRIENGVYLPNRDKLAQLQFHTVQQQVLEMHEALINRLVAFCKKDLRIELNAEQGEKALQLYLEDNQLQVALSASQGTLIPQVDSPTKSVRFVVGSFIRHLQETQSSSFEYLETIVKGNMLANAIFLTEPGQHQRRFRNTEIYFDTSFLIFSLGYAGEPRRAPCLELLELLYETGAELRCFSHTRDEVRGVLDATARRMARGRLGQAYGPSVEYFLSEGFTASDVELRATRVERDLQALRIRVVDNPPYSHFQHVIDEQGLTEILESTIEYRNPLAVTRDVASISAVMRLREGREPYYVEESRAVFVTMNARLATEARKFCCDNLPNHVVPPCLTDYTLTNILWLKKPTTAPSLPRKRIIADCYAATQPDAALWNLYLEEIRRLERDGSITSDDYYMLRHSRHAKAELMRVTLGQPEAFAQGTVPEILAFVKARIQAAVQEELVRETLRRETVEKTLEAREAEETERLFRIRERGQKYAAVAVKVIEYAVIILLFVGTLSTFPWRLPPLSHSTLRYALTLLQFLLLILSVWNLMYGTPLKSVIRRFEILLSHFFVERLADLAEIEYQP